MSNKRQRSLDEFVTKKSSLPSAKRCKNPPIRDGDASAASVTDAQIIDAIHKMMQYAQAVKRDTGICPITNFGYREIMALNLVKRCYPGAEVVHVGNMRGSKQPENRFDLKMRFDSGEPYETVECKSMTVSASQNITPSTSIGTYSDLPVKIEKIMTCNRYAYSLFVGLQVLPMFFVLIKRSGHDMHDKILTEKEAALQKSRFRREEEGTYKADNQQNCKFEIRDLRRFAAPDLIVLYYARPLDSRVFLRWITNSPVVAPTVDYDRMYAMYIEATLPLASSDASTLGNGGVVPFPDDMLDLRRDADDGDDDDNDDDDDNGVDDNNAGDDDGDDDDDDDDNDDASVEGGGGDHSTSGGRNNNDALVERC